MMNYILRFTNACALCVDFDHNFAVSLLGWSISHRHGAYQPFLCPCDNVMNVLSYLQDVAFDIPHTTPYVPQDFTLSSAPAMFDHSNGATIFPLHSQEAPDWNLIRANDLVDIADVDTSFSTFSHDRPFELHSARIPKSQARLLRHIPQPLRP